MQPKRPFAVFLYLCGVGLLFSIIGILLLSLSSALYDAIFRGNLVLRPDNFVYSIWIKNPLPIYLKIYMFNWTNSHEINNHTSVKLKFHEMGPYSYKEVKEKTNITWNANDTVTYRILRHWFFERESSNGSIFDLVTSIHPIGLAAAYTSRNFNYFLKRGLSITLYNMLQKIQNTQPVGQVLFNGYQDSLLTLASKFAIFAKNEVPITDRFGWFYGRNGSSEFDGVFNIDTGATGAIGQLHQWKYSDHTPYYPGECGKVSKASAGEFFPRDLTKDSVIKFFSADMCRYIELEYETEVLVNGIIGYKYTAGDRFLDNGTKIPANKCFCDGDCMPSGAMNVSNCRHGSPAFVSLPHFYKADPSYLQNVEGLKPDKERHDFYMIFDPKTGIPLEVAARLQLNIRLQPISGISLYENLPVVYFPVLYFEQKVTIPDDMAFLLKLFINFDVICFAIATILLSIGIFVNICMCYKICTMSLVSRHDKLKMEDRQKMEAIPLNQ